MICCIISHSHYLPQVIAAEGEQKASQALRQAAEVMAESPASLQVSNSSLQSMLCDKYGISKDLRSTKKLLFIFIFLL